jgi:hypothetical protein
MTLIALTVNAGCPILVGDLLTTSEQVDTEPAIPVFMKGVHAQLPAMQRLLPAKLRQKIYVVNERLAVALAGSEYEMKFFLEELKNHFKYRDVTLPELDQFLKDFDYAEVAESAALMLVGEMKERGVEFGLRSFGKWHHQSAPNYQLVMACGSGSSHFLREAAVEMVMEGAGDTDPLSYALSTNYTLLARLLLQERANLETIKKYWGAGYEIIYHDGQKFVKMDDVTYLIFTGKLDLIGDRHETNLALLLNFKYHGDLLAISASDGQRAEGYGALPIYLRKEDLDHSLLPSRAHFESRHTCSIYLLELPNGTTIAPALFAQRAAEPGMVTLNEPVADEMRSVFRGGKIPDPGPVSVRFDDEDRLCVFTNLRTQNYLLDSVRRQLIAHHSATELGITDDQYQQALRNLGSSGPPPAGPL